MAQIKIFEAKTYLSTSLRQALAGKEVMIARAGKPRVQLRPVAAKNRWLGGWEGKITIGKDFDAASAEIETLFGCGPKK